MLIGNGEASSGFLAVRGETWNPSGRSLDRSWYAVYTRLSHEVQVSRHFKVREIENFLPQYKVVRRWKNRCTKRLDLPLFPGYIFVRIADFERVRVLESPSVLSIVGSAGRPIPLPDCEIEALRTGIQARNAAPHPFLKMGERARIRSGTMAGMEGVVIRSKNRVRVVISLDLIMKSMAVEVDWDELEAVASDVPSACQRPRSATSSIRVSM